MKASILFASLLLLLHNHQLVSSKTQCSDHKQCKGLSLEHFCRLDEGVCQSCNELCVDDWLNSPSSAAQNLTCKGVCEYQWECDTHNECGGGGWCRKSHTCEQCTEAISRQCFEDNGVYGPVDSSCPCCGWKVDLNWEVGIGEGFGATTSDGKFMVKPCDPSIVQEVSGYYHYVAEAGGSATLTEFLEIASPCGATKANDRGIFEVDCQEELDSCDEKVLFALVATNSDGQQLFFDGAELYEKYGIHTRDCALTTGEALLSAIFGIFLGIAGLCCGCLVAISFCLGGDD